VQDHIVINRLKSAVKRLLSPRLDLAKIQRVNLCSGTQKIPGYVSVDFVGEVDLRLDLAKSNLPFEASSLDAVTCVSAINYFSRTRGQEIVNETFRVLKRGGIARFSTQDMEIISRRYIDKDIAFFFQKLADGRERFEGATLGDKFAAWFYGYKIEGRPCQYFYDYDSLAHLFKTAGFSIVERRQFMDSRLDCVDLIDNRPEQMFFLEAVK
jgi:SAM-dependent methyltransferase